MFNKQDTLVFDEKFNKLHEVIIKDTNNINTSFTCLQGEVEFRNEFNEVLFKKKNLIVLRGRTFVLEKIFNSYLKKGGLVYNSGIVEDSPVANRRVCLFMIGKGGSGLTFGDVYVPQFNDLTLADPLPFRFVDTGESLGGESNKYFGKNLVGAPVVGKDAYYYKKFEANPTFYHGGEGGSEDEVYMEIALKVNKDDVREFFVENSGLEDCRINELALLIGKENAGETEFEQVEIFSRITFNNEPLDNETRELNIYYRIYA